MTEIPPYHALFNLLLESLRSLGDSATIEELNEEASKLIGLPSELLETRHDLESGNETELEYRLAWARTYLKKFGLIDNSSRGVWALTQKADEIRKVDPVEVVKYVRSLRPIKDKIASGTPPEETADPAPEEEVGWRIQLYRLLTTEMAPAGFERLVQRLLRESGFVQVEVTGRSGDGGIDGRGIARIHGLMSFHVIFQCKRYKETVSSSEIRNFRGAMVGRGDKGLFITTGSFTRDAIKEATRDGAPPIDLLDGQLLVEKLKELRLGVRVEKVEAVTIDPDWFKEL